MVVPVALTGRAPPVYTIQLPRICPGSKVLSPRLRASKVQEVDQVVQEGVQPSRLAQLRGGQKVASAAAFAASLLGLAHLVLHVFSQSTTRPVTGWLSRPLRHGVQVQARVALSGFLSAHPLEYPGLLLASSAVTGACEAAARVNCSRNYRSLYLSLAIAGLCYIFDESAVAQQLHAVASTGATGAFFFAAYVAYSILDWLSNGVSFSEVFLGVRASRKLGLPQPWRASEPSSSRLLPKLYALAEGMCLLEMARSTLWRAGRLLPVLAALDELRRASSRPEQLSSPEAAQLNKGVGFWAWSALVEAALLGVLCSSWARHLGYTGLGVALSGLASAFIAAAPALVVLSATFIGWSRSESALVELTRERPQQPLERLGRYDLQKLEGLYLDSVTTFYSEFYDRPSSMDSVKPINDCEYYRVKVRLQKAGSKVLRYCRHDIQRLMTRQEAQELTIADAAQLPAASLVIEEPVSQSEAQPGKELPAPVLQPEPVRPPDPPAEVVPPPELPAETASGEIAEGVTEELDTAPAAKPDVGASNASKEDVQMQAEKLEEPLAGQANDATEEQDGQIEDQTS